MGSNEEYLDDLLNALNQQETDGDMNTEAVLEPDLEEEAGMDLNSIDEAAPAFDLKPSTDEIKDMSEDEILQLLQYSSMESEPEEPTVEAEAGSMNEDDELDALLRGMEQDDANLAEINDLLFKSEENQPVEQEEEEIPQPEASLEDGSGEKGDKKPGKKMKKEKAPKAKKERKGLFSKKKEKEAEGQEDSEETPLDDTIFADDSLQFEPSGTVEENPEELNPMEENLAELDQDAAGENQTEEGTPDILSDNPEEESFFMDIDQLVEEASGLMPEEVSAAPDEAEDNSKPVKEKKKKPVFLAKFLDFLFEEDEDQEEGSDRESGEGIGALGVTSDENQEVLKQLKKEDKEGKKKKKKKGKGKDVVPEDAEDDEVEESADSKKKAKKPKKEKKEKPPKPEPDTDTPEPKLSKKKVRATGFFAFTILAALLVCCLVIPGLLQLADARSAYYDGDYETCYRGLYGKKLSDSDQLMFERAHLMLSVDRNKEVYENYVAVGDEMRALDALLQAVDKQDKILIEAEKYELTAQAEAAYQEILTILAEKYQISESDAKEINAYEQDVVYTLRVKSIVEGTPFELPEFLKENPGADPEAGNYEDLDKPMEDVLAAEEEITDTAYEEGIQEP